MTWRWSKPTPIRFTLFRRTHFKSCRAKGETADCGFSDFSGISGFFWDFRILKIPKSNRNALSQIMEFRTKIFPVCRPRDS